MTEKHMTGNNTINLVEVFSSIQGEGLYVGCRQLFVRLAGCNLACSYCDTQDSKIMPQQAKFEQFPGKRNFRAVNNPLNIEKLAEHLNCLLRLPHHSVSITGGEPLCQPVAISQLLPLLKAPIYLETNGTLTDNLALILPYIRIISMDIKLPSSTGKSYWQEHSSFLEIAKQREVFVKIVITSATMQSEMEQAVDLIASIDYSIPLVLQPVTPYNGYEAISPDDMLFFQEKALSKLADVRVIPQTHKFIGQM
ncbi:MAG TPA: 7-carboxy-7-deazaguanine synthase QueE [Methylomusa anaerophila]|uniref:7-carboxy-7-deazaguanine synthase n=1 Tax=Methylomusa anaerophila TaxID=1930071 RepID=A0A348APR5_9FIRM|nr:7-carboxy-7-deazaguanine synthase QueE [Methylomusa anaerophila]BBB93063.1 7-carboxy-7-deazaguanine synthase [Methylomusa anaerophila]HML87104.1 7-carboxy-7-deazaguanine synthase QueE [Methylomusa anaerophila]